MHQYSKTFVHIFIKNLITIGIGVRNSSVLPEDHCFWKMSSNGKLIDHSAFQVETVGPLPASSV